MTYQNILAYLAAFFCLVSSSMAQTSDNPWMAGLSASFLDYQGPLTGDYTQVNNFNPGLSVGAYAYIVPALNFSLNTLFVPQANYPLSEARFLGTSLLDVNAMVQLKSNGTIFDEHAFFAPYLATGFGLNTASNNLRLYVPAALGIRLRFGRNFSLQIQSIYKQRLGEGKFQHIEHSAGFVFALPTNRKPIKKEKPAPRQKPSKRQFAAFADADGDGVADKDDLCPDVKGKAMYLGCPEEDLTAPDPKDAKPTIAANTMKTETQPPASADPYPVIQDEVNLTELGEPENYLEPSSEDLQYISEAMDNVYFEYASDDLTLESLSVLDNIAEILQRYPHYTLQVMGHTDNTGPGNDNLVLSIKRAFRVKYYLVYEKGIRMARISSDGYSSVAPIADNETESGRAKNRRVEFKLVKSSESGIGFQSSY